MDQDDANGLHVKNCRNETMRNSTEAVRQFFDALNRNDLQAALEDFHPDIVRAEPEGFPASGTYRGIATVKEHFTKARATWAEGSCNLEKMLQNGDKVVVYVHVRVRLNGATEWIEGRIADGFVLRDGKIVEYRTFGERASALAWAGIEI